MHRPAPQPRRSPLPAQGGVATSRCGIAIRLLGEWILLSRHTHQSSIWDAHLTIPFSHLIPVCVIRCLWCSAVLECVRVLSGCGIVICINIIISGAACISILLYQVAARRSLVCIIPCCCWLRASLLCSPFMHL